MERPYIICHMVTSLDGRLLPDHWPVSLDKLMTVYDTAANRLDADGWVVGRETMQHYIDHGASRSGIRIDGRGDKIATFGGQPLAICFDRTGRLRPTSGDLDGDHLVLVVSNTVTQDCIEELTRAGVSVFFVDDGPDAIADVLSRISAAFGVKRLLIEGGGILNGAFLTAGLIDETSTLVAPVVDGKSGAPAIYERRGISGPQQLRFISTQPLADGYVWLRHQVVRGMPGQSDLNELSADQHGQYVPA